LISKQRKEHFYLKECVSVEVEKIVAVFYFLFEFTGNIFEWVLREKKHVCLIDEVCEYPR